MQINKNSRNNRLLKELVQHLYGLFSKQQKRGQRYVKKSSKKIITDLKKGKKPTLYAILPIVLITIGLFVFSYYQNPYVVDNNIPKNTTLTACKIHSISDGDTVTAHCFYDEKNTRLKVRVWGIDAPETGQKPWGERSTAYLKSLITNKKDVSVEILDVDRYQRYVAKIYQGEPIEENDLGLKMVEAGQAVVYQQYNSDKLYLATEKTAKNEKIGIWSEPGDQQNPAEWRKLNRR